MVVKPFLSLGISVLVTLRSQSLMLEGILASQSADNVRGDRTIIGTAVPTISSEFDSFGDIAWYESGFLLPLCVLQLSFGRIYQDYSAKWVMIINIAIFEIGSIVCALALTSETLIISRVITGIGGAGVPPGAFLLVSFLVPPQARPKYFGSIGSVFGVTSITGPILGGYLTSITWRRCFWINLPVGGVSMFLLTLLTPKCIPPVKRSDTWKGKFLQLDPIGFVLVATFLVCLLLAIQFGGKEYRWNSGSVIALLVIFAIFGIAFVGVQVWRGEKVAVIVSGIVASSIGYYVPAMLTGATLAIVGGALISTWSVNVSAGKWIGYQIIAGVGLGLILQGPNIAAQTVPSKEDVSIGLFIISLANFLGSTVFVTVGQALLQAQLLKKLQIIVPGFDSSRLTDGGASSIRTLASSEQLPAVLQAYNESIRTVWFLALGLAYLILLASLGLECKNVKNQDTTHVGAPDTVEVGDRLSREGREEYEKTGGKAV
ncbi:major facilitator superfamily domain-containing protein [Ampelomyces quisqualis]|uniref:Major facilitator superfamily domain-containing protein n=1 Tax=Ampelomyces quisqualis TaxID=50730 RepID=A0A6A5QY43_AMPQU|nr:major facilitator superfamily domain-containing protein [Ampelomyces quisqualis]